MGRRRRKRPCTGEGQEFGADVKRLAVQRSPFPPPVQQVVRRQQQAGGGGVEPGQQAAALHPVHRCVWRRGRAACAAARACMHSLAPCVRCLLCSCRPAATPTSRPSPPPRPCPPRTPCLPPSNPRAKPGRGSPCLPHPCPLQTPCLHSCSQTCLSYQKGWARCLGTAAGLPTPTHTTTTPTRPDHRAFTLCPPVPDEVDSLLGQRNHQEHDSTTAINTLLMLASSCGGGGAAPGGGGRLMRARMKWSAAWGPLYCLNPSHPAVPASVLCSCGPAV